uniref:Uncharacterized protein n=1 Tax=Rhizophora mucronata TaxID=61149 RepID=A0A2P2ND81_RHIMU
MAFWLCMVELLA